jgi:hypothetical protein
VGFVMTPFDFLNAITKSKEKLMTGSDNDDLAEKSYSSFLVNRGLSYYSDTILYANEMNRLCLLDNKPQFSYLLNSIRSRKRYSKWFKKEKIEKLDIVSEYFGYSKSKSKDIINILTDEQIKTIKQKLEKGGVNTKERKK